MMASIKGKNDKLVRSMLQEGETLVWTGSTEPYKILTAESKKGLFIRWGLCIIAVILWAVYCIAFFNTEGASKFGLIVSMILIVIFFLYIALIPMADRKKILEKNSYYLTNRRAIFLDGSDKEYAINLYGVNADFLPAEEGCTTLLLRQNASGSKVERKIPKSLRTIAWKPIRDEYAGGLISDMVFYNVKSDPALTRPFH